MGFQNPCQRRIFRFNLMFAVIFSSATHSQNGRALKLHRGATYGEVSIAPLQPVSLTKPLFPDRNRSIESCRPFTASQGKEMGRIPTVRFQAIIKGLLPLVQNSVLRPHLTPMLDVNPQMEPYHELSLAFLNAGFTFTRSEPAGQ